VWPHLWLWVELQSFGKSDKNNHAGDGATLRCGVSVLPPVRGVAGCHSLHLPRAQEICPHPLAKDAKVNYN